MLILTRRIGETLVIGDDINITILNLDERSVKIGVNAPIEIPVHREEVYKRIQNGEPIPRSDDTNEIIKGNILFIMEHKNYGFISSPTFRNKIFFHSNSVKDGDFRSFYEGMPVKFALTRVQRGLAAVDVTPVAKTLSLNR